MLGSAELILAGIAKNVGHLPAFAAFNAVVQVFKRPIQALAQRLPDAGLARTHEADQKNGVE